MTKGFYELNPHDVLNAVEEAGFLPTGEMNQLNSYENRVFDIKLEKESAEHERIVAKFYRPGRWSIDSIQDEHDFLKELNLEGIPAVAPLILKNGKTILKFHDLFVALFPKIKARMPEEFLGNDLEQIGLLLAKLHNVGSRKKANHRKNLNTDFFGWDSLNILDEWVAPEIRHRYFDAAEEILNYLDDQLDEKNFIRIHGDCHRGNILHSGKEFFFVDFDDFCMGPIEQDFWMLLSGDNFESEAEQIILGYDKIRHFKINQNIFEPLRGLRIIYYARWIATRWEDPSFPRIFPDFGSFKYWAEEVEALEKIAWSI